MTYALATINPHLRGPRPPGRDLTRSDQPEPPDRRCTPGCRGPRSTPARCRT